jgi:hypothetical protein
MSVDQSKATVVSLCPFPIDEFKPGLIPSNFRIPTAEDGDIQVLVIPATIINRFRVPVVGNIINQSVPAIQVARAIVEDRLTGQLAYAVDCHPGLFWVPGAYTKQEAKVQLADLIAAETLTQRKWFGEIVKMADDDWNKHHQHKFITNLQRHAAKILNLDKDWNREQLAVSASLKDCIACFTKIDARANICPNCRSAQSVAKPASIKV